MRTSFPVLIFIFLCLATKAQTTLALYETFLSKDKKEIFELYQKYNAEIAVNPENAQAFFERGMLKYSRNDALNAMADLQKAIILNPKVSVYHCAYAFILRNKGEYEAAIRECDEALKYDEKFVDALNLRGNALDNLKRPEEARVNYEKSLQINPTDASIYLCYATSYAITNNLDEAEKKLSMVLKLEPDSYDGLMLKAILYGTQKKYHEAIEVIDKLIKTKKKLPDLYMMKAEVYDSLHNQPKVCECMYNLALGNSSGAYEYIMMHCVKEQEYRQMKVMTLQRKGEELKNLKKYKEAVEVYDEAIRLMPDSGLSYYNRGLIKCDMENYKGAIEDCMTEIKKQPYFGDAYLVVAYSYVSLGEFEKAKEYYLKCMKVDPLNAMAYYVYANLISKKEVKYNESVYYYKYAIDVKPDYVEAYYELGEVYAKLGMNAEACESFKLAEKLGEVKAISKRIWYCSQ